MTTLRQGSSWVDAFAAHLVAWHGILELLGQGDIVKSIFDAAQQREVVAEPLV